MTTIQMRRLSLALTLVAAALGAKQALAWTTTTCNGDTEGIRDNVTFGLNRCSIEVGSAREGVVLYAMNEWNRVVGAADRFAATSGSTSCTIPTGDGFIIAFVAPGDIDNNAGLTKSSVDACIFPFIGTDGEVTDATVMIANNLPLNSIGETDSTLGARETTVHELGHVLGMDHVDTTMTVMCTAGTCGKYGARDAPTGTFFGNTESLHPDDIAFLARFHATSGGAVDVGASAWTNIGTTFQLTHPTLTTFVACPGQVVSVSFSHGIKGKNNVSSAHPLPARIVFSPNNVISATDTTATSFSVFGNRGHFFTNTFAVTVPPLVPGTYDIGLVIDPDNTVAETDEGNNTTLLNRRVTVPAGCP